MTHRIYPSNITKLLSVERYRILTQELVLKVFSSLLVAPPVAPPQRANGAALSLAAHQRSTEHTDITEFEHIILSEYFMLVKKIDIIPLLWADSHKTNFPVWGFCSLFFKYRFCFGFFFLRLRRIFKWIIRT